MEVQNAIYLTLLHSLWMGLVLALTTGVVIVATRKSKAVTRYNILTMLLLVFVLGIGAVFYKSLTGSSSAVGISSLGSVAKEITNQHDASASKIQNGEGILTSLDSIVVLWSTYSNQIVLIWFLIICAKCIQLLMGLHSIYYLKRTQIFVAGRFWENKVAELSLKLGISKRINIFQSGIAKVPMIAGYFKPVILMPIGMLNGISTAEVEAILSHELAHLKRNDYLVNILQSLIEIVFFFNPGVLWISKLMREERENCCDDLALSCTESKHQYIKALISCQEFRTDHTPYAMAITGKKNHLKERVARMLFNNNSTLNKMEKTILSITLISALTVTAAFNKITYTTDDKVLTAVSVSNPFMAIGQPFCIIDQPMMGPEVTLLKPEDKCLDDTSKYSKNKKKSTQKNTTSNSVTQTRTTNQQVNIDQQEPVAPKPPTPPKAPKAPTAPKSPVAPTAPPASDMTTDLFNDGLLKDTKNFTFTMNSDKLIINGEQQSESAHRKYMAKYLKTKRGTITTTVSSN